MYTIYRNAVDENNIIHIEGEIDEASNLKEELTSEIVKLSNLTKSPFIIDLSGLSFISTEGVNILAEINQSRPLSFNGYSVYVGTLLDRKNLIQNTPEKEQEIED